MRGKKGTWCFGEADVSYGKCAAQPRRRRRKGEPGGTEGGRWQTLSWERRMTGQLGIRPAEGRERRDGKEERGELGRVKVKKHRNKVGG